MLYEVITVQDGTPIPTPWDQAAYDEVSNAYQEKRQALRAAGDAAEIEDHFDERHVECHRRDREVVPAQAQERPAEHSGDDRRGEPGGDEGEGQRPS